MYTGRNPNMTRTNSMGVGPVGGPPSILQGEALNQEIMRLGDIGATQFLTRDQLALYQEQRQKKDKQAQNDAAAANMIAGFIGQRRLAPGFRAQTSGPMPTLLGMPPATNTLLTILGSK